MVSNFVILWVLCVCVFLTHFLCFLCFPVCFILVGLFYLPVHFLKRERKQVQSWVSGEVGMNDRGRNEREQIIIRIYCLKNNYFQLKNKFPML